MIEIGAGIIIGAGITIGNVSAYNTEFVTEDSDYVFITEDGQILIEEQ